MNSIQVREVQVTSPEYKQVWQLREDVLRKPLGLSLKNEDLSGDKTDVILAAFEGDKIKGCVMLHRKGDGVMKLRQMAVADDAQGKGIGRELIAAAEQYAMGAGCKKTDMHARMVAKGFYEKLGYAATGAIFTEVGIPHIAMEKQILP